MGFSIIPFLALFLPLSFLLYWGCRHHTRLQRIMIIIAGPILRYGKMKSQITSERQLSFYAFQKAVVLFMWGTFMKMVIADRIKILVDTIFESYRSYGG